MTHWKRPWCWERWRGGGEGGDRGWDGWMTSLTQWTWVWINSRSWWWTGRPGVLQSLRSQSQTQLSDWTELNWTVFTMLYITSQDLFYSCKFVPFGPFLLFCPTLPHPSPLETTDLFLYLWAWFSVLFGLVDSPNISGIMQYLSFSIWFISLAMMSSRSTHVVANGKISCFMVG